MKHIRQILRATVIYFPLVAIYKFRGDYYGNYWVNYFWTVLSLYLMYIFINILKFLNEHYLNNPDDKDYRIYKLLCKNVVAYWGVMASLRIFLFFRIDLYPTLISSAASKFTIGGVFILISFIYLLFKIWHRK